ncbi:DUF1659 domain-containing protein [Bacillus sp. V3B]|uniref:DUF1659 domain-containing protein n=1 Tax=Bacillus sp. V3B TaxID=2804915 RepID=UPI00210E2D37|nr:DUF1659 domain-containing protein [Bacillus sp. V3B]MCQ6277169.1 DUF1659 domain-containing protein [Bacillus sp. V3B]
MAEAMVKDLKLRVSYETGVNEKGEPVFKTKTYSNVVETATATELYQVAQAIASLSAYPMSGVEKNDLYEIIG